MNAIVLILSLLGATEHRYTLDTSLWSIVKELRVADASPERAFLGDVFPTIQEALPVVDVTINARPTGPDRFYRIELTLQQPITVREGGRTVLIRGMRYVTTLTPDGNQTKVTSSIALDVQLPQSHCRFVQRAIDRIGGRLVSEAEQGILRRARAKMEALGARSKE